MTEPAATTHSGATDSGARVLWQHADPDHAREATDPPLGAAELAARLANEPLALRLMGRLLREHPLSMGGYAGALQSLGAADNDATAGVQPVPAPLDTVCVLSMNQLDQQHLTCARPLLALLSFLGAAGVPVPLRCLAQEALQGTVVDGGNEPPSAPDLELALGVLAAHGFVSRRFMDSEATIVLHPVVTRVIRERLGSAGLEIAESASVVLARGNGHDFDMEDAAYRAVLAVRERLMGSDHPDTLWTQHRLADLAARRGDLNTAEAAYRELLQAQHQALGHEHPDTLWSRHRLAWVAHRRGDVDTAASGYRELLDIQMRVLGDRHPYTRLTQEALAEVTRA